MEEEGEDPSLPQGSALLSLSKVGSLTASLPLEVSGFPQVLSVHTLKRGLILFLTLLMGGGHVPAVASVWTPEASSPEFGSLLPLCGSWGSNFGQV